MAHVGQELALGLVGGLELGGAFLDSVLQRGVHSQYLRLQCAPFGDIDQDTMGALEAALQVTLDIATDLRGDGRAIPAAQMQVAADLHPVLELAESHGKFVAPILIPVIAEAQTQHGLGPVKAQQLGHLVVGLQPVSLDVQGLVGHGQALEQCPEPRFALAEVRLHLPPLGDIEADARQGRRAAGGRRTDIGPGFDPPGVPGRQQDAVIQRQGSSVTGGGGRLPLGDRQILRMHARAPDRPGFQIRCRGFRGHAEKLPHLPGPPDSVSGQVPVPEPCFGRPGSQPQPVGESAFGHQGRDQSRHQCEAEYQKEAAQDIGGPIDAFEVRAAAKAQPVGDGCQHQHAGQGGDHPVQPLPGAPGPADHAGQQHESRQQAGQVQGGHGPAIVAPTGMSSA